MGQGTPYGSLQSRMKPQLSHLSLQCNSIITAPQRSHAQVLASVCIVVPMQRTPSVMKSTRLRKNGGFRIAAQKSALLTLDREV